MQDINKILLIFPAAQGKNDTLRPVCTTPLGLLYIAAFLKDRYEVRLLDAVLEGSKNIRELPEYGIVKHGLSPAQIMERIEKISPDVVGLSCVSSWQFEDIRQTCRLIKQWKKSIVTVVGGQSPTFLAEEYMKDASIDYIVLGEGEKTFRQLMDNLSSGSSVLEIEGLVFRENGSVKINYNRRFIEAIDNIPFPARELLDMERYFSLNCHLVPHSRRHRVASLITSRGCTHSCIFCSSTSFWGNRYRTRSAENVLAEIEELKERYNIQEIEFLDDNLTADRSRAKSIFEGMIKKKLNIKWCMASGVAVWTLDEELLELMKESGCYQVYLAVESGSQDVLDKIIKKPVNLKRLELIVRKLKQLKMQADAFLIVGFPGETKDQIKETLSAPQRLGLDFVFTFIASPFPGTELLRQCLDLGYLDNAFDPRITDVSLSSFETAEFSSGELERLVKKANISNQVRAVLKNPAIYGPVFMQQVCAQPASFLKGVFTKLKWQF